MEKTPQEYAEELVKEMCGNTPKKEDVLLSFQDWESCKKNAKTAVDRILLAIDWHEFEVPNKQIEYFEQVKTEIENL